MSLARRLLNPWLRVTERRRLARATDPETLRRAFACNARLVFWPPRGAVFEACEVAGRPATRVDPARPGPLLLYFHGGGYVFGAPRTHRAMLAHLARLAECPALLPDYRLAPEHAFPAAFDDALASYCAVIDHPGGVVLGGDSAGGGLALAVLAEILAQGLPKPLGAFAFSPLTDMTCSGASIRTNARSDVILPAARCHEVAGMYLQGADPRDRRASPLAADFTGAPPVWLTASEDEILRDDTLRMSARLRAKGGAVTETIATGLPHVWPLMHTLLPEGRASLRALALWIRRLSPRAAGS
ncbi:alpha/beta hydrolase [Marinovum sp.]|uniref:alpha/beta hydrolase n=1 Tax=Marinovum sp. TaxID=2024839 RepID=UPI002B26B341|nr:alpha/beta hydrolase [Marinovum sp.]